MNAKADERRLIRILNTLTLPIFRYTSIIINHTDSPTVSVK